MSEIPVLDRFIVLEGLDGAGTTTQASALAAELSRERKTHSTCEPTRGDIGVMIRRVLKGTMPARPETVAHLFVADRIEHLYQGPDSVTARLEAGEIVISDRYFFSSLAYQSVECGFDYVHRLNGGFPLPRHLFFLDIEAAVGEDRMASRENREIYERLSFQEKVRENYRRALDFYRESAMAIHVLDGTDTPEAISREILSRLAEDPTLTL